MLARMSEPAPTPDVSPDRPVVLIVEDEVLVRMLIADVLQEAGYRIIEAANADEALRVLQARPDVHVVVTDVEMPPSPTGYDLAAQVRERWPYVQVLVSSGRVFPAQLPDGVTFIAKPWTAESLARCVHQAVERAGQGPSC
jgi:CheY-like chemotaxis protein